MRYLATISEGKGEGLHLNFDPKDYERNLTTAKNAQTVIYQAVGRSLEKGLKLPNNLIGAKHKEQLFG